MHHKAFFHFIFCSFHDKYNSLVCLLQLEWILPSVTYICKYSEEKHSWSIYKILNPYRGKLHLHLLCMFTLKDNDFDLGLFLVPVNQTLMKVNQTLNCSKNSTSSTPSADSAATKGTFHFLSAPLLRMAGFRKGGFGFCFQRSRQNLDPSEIFFKGADKQSTLRISFFKGHRKKN